MRKSLRQIGFIAAAMLCLGRPASLYATPIFVSGGSAPSGASFYLCKIKPSGKLVPGTAADQLGSRWRSIASQIQRVNRNRRLSSAARQTRIKALRALARNILGQCSATQSDPIPVTPISSPLVGKWQTSYSCAEVRGLDCVETLTLNFMNDGTYEIALNGARLCLKDNPYGGLYEFKYPAEQRVDIYGRYSFASDGILTLNQDLASAHWDSCPLFGSAAKPEATDLRSLVSIQTFASFNQSSSTLLLQNPCPYDNPGLDFCGFEGLFVPPFTRISY